MIRHVSFDFDGVLAQGSNAAYLDCYHRTLQKIGVSLKPEVEKQRIIDRWGQSIEGQMSWLLQEYPEKVDEAINFFETVRHEQSFRDRVSLFSGAEHVVRELHLTKTLSIVTGSGRGLVASVLGSELLPLFSSIECGPEYSSELQKPSPYMLEQAILKIRVLPAETVYIGDGPNDIRMAKASGTTAIALLTGPLTRLQATELGASKVLESITEVPDAISEISNQ